MERGASRTPPPGNLQSAPEEETYYEFDRAPIPRERLLGPGHFAGSYAGEHVAATEFVIGVLFVSWGAGITDVFWGLALGNLLAVLTWTLLCAPVAVQTRLTLYWYLRRIGGPGLTAVANVLNAVLYCVLAGCMITVSASAVRIPFGIPEQTAYYPDDIRFVVVVVAVGAVVVWLAIAGFRNLATFAMVCAPWMFLMFVAGAVVALPKLGFLSQVGEIDGWGAFWEMGGRMVWTGRTPEGNPGLGFFHIAAFAWSCNLAMHAGLSDMALLRYARKARYGLFSSFGAFLGHYVAWIAAGVMGAGAAAMLGRSLDQLDSGSVAYATLGWAGVLAVIIAGWTTSNPTLYRAGLALQAVTRNGSRQRITLIVGIATTAIACFPFVFTRLLDFVAIYGLLLSPVGAIVLTEHWIFPRVGLSRYWHGRTGGRVNFPALAAWGIAVALGIFLELSGTLHLFFLFIPVYLGAGLLYLGMCSRVAAARTSTEEDDAGASTEATRAATEAPKAPPMNGVTLALGLGALVCLVLCLTWSWQVQTDDIEAFEASHTWLRTWLVVPTIAYFLLGTAYALRRRPRTG
jgi:NCS1 family nucleobase:cation symporter-1